MPVDTPHPDYEKTAILWRKARDCAGGEEAVKARGAEYLPKLDGQTTEDYAAYKMRAMLYGATGRTVQGLVGALLRKPPAITWPDGDRERLDAIGHSAESLGSLLQIAADELMTIGRIGFLVDVPFVHGGTERPDPYVSTYFGENIVNWREEVRRGRRQLTMVVLQEREEVQDPEDPFVVEERVRYRVLRLGTAPAWVNTSDDPEKPNWSLADGFTEQEATGFGFYYQELWVEDASEKAKKTYMLADVITPRRPGGALWEEIPFALLNPVEIGPDVEKPPLIDLVNVNLSHYRNSADLEHGLHFTALPTPYAIGFDTKKTKLKIGAGTAWVTDDSKGKVGMLEFKGAGLEAIEKQMDRKERLMATIGARLLEGQKKVQEAAAAIRLRSAGEQSALANVADVLSEGFTRLLRWVRAWTRPAEPEKEIGVEIAKDFDPAGMEPAQLQALMLALQGGGISWETWVYQLQVGEVLPEGVSADEEWERIQRGLPAGLGVLLDDGSGDPGGGKDDAAA